MQQDNQPHSFSSFAEFQTSQQELTKICNQLLDVFQESQAYGLEVHNLTTEIENISSKLKSQSFKIVIAGEFSRGKSTLVNALLGESIQPMRAIACNSTITVFKYGLQKRILCCYKDGREKEVSFEDYQVAVTIPREAVKKHLSEELMRSEIEQIIFEHPDLIFCQNGVEIIDSPGLNEHPDRAEITKRLLKDADAVIFLTIATQALTQAERDLVQDLITQLNGGKENKPTNSLFIVVNRMDDLDSQEDRQDVQEVVQEFAYGQNAVITGDNRVHFISAKDALEAIISKTENEYLEAFQNFIQSVENFLILERGSVEINQSGTRLEGISQNALNLLSQQLEKKWDANIKASEAEKQIIMEKIGEVSGHGVRIRSRVEKLMSEMREKVKQEVHEAWNEWVKGDSWKNSLRQKSENWDSGKNIVFDQKGLITDFVTQFSTDWSELINEWTNNKVGEILKHRVKMLDEEIALEMRDFREKVNFEEIDTDKKYGWQDNRYNSSYTGGFAGDFIDYLLGVVIAGSLGFLALAIFEIFNPVALAITLAAALITGAGFGIGGIKTQIKKAVFEECTKKLEQSNNEIITKLLKEIDSVIRDQVVQTILEDVDTIVKEVLSSYENRLEQQESKHKNLLEQYKAEQAFIYQKRNELQQVQRNIEAIFHFWQAKKLA